MGGLAGRRCQFLPAPSSRLLGSNKKRTCGHWSVVMVLCGRLSWAHLRMGQPNSTTPCPCILLLILSPPSAVLAFLCLAALGEVGWGQ